MQEIKDYVDLIVIKDISTSFIVDIDFMNNISEKFNLNPLNFVTLAPFSWECGLKITEIELDFKSTDTIVSSVTHRTYSCVDYEKSYVTCNSSNIICLITCSNCFMQYVGETVIVYRGVQSPT